MDHDDERGSSGDGVSPKQPMTGDTEKSLLEWAREQKEEASDRYYEEKSGSFEQGLVLGRRHAMSDVIELLLEISRETNREHEGSNNE